MGRGRVLERLSNPSDTHGIKVAKKFTTISSLSLSKATSQIPNGFRVSLSHFYFIFEIDPRALSWIGARYSAELCQVKDSLVNKFE